MTIDSNRLNDLLISIAFHLIILFTLSLLTIHVKVSHKDLTVFMESSFENVIDNSDIAKIGDSSQKDNAVYNNNDTNKAIDNINATNDALSSTYENYKSIEPPVKKVVTNNPNKFIAGLSKSSLSDFSSGSKSSGSGNNGYLLEEDDGTISVIHSILPNPVLNDFGKVTLVFTLNSDGSVKPESIIPTVIDDPNYTRESIVALKQWKFLIRSYNKDKKYRISFIFSPQ